MNKRLIAPIASALAIFGFFMPWMSCGSIVWSGMDLASGNLGSMGMGGDMGKGDAEPLLWVVPVAALLIIGLYFMFKGKERLSSALVPTIVIAALAIFVMALKYIDVQDMNAEATAPSGQESAATSEDSLGAEIAEGMGQMMGSMVKLKIEWGFWFTGAMFLLAIFGATQYRDLPKPPEDVAATSPPYSGEPAATPTDETSNIPQDRGMS